LELFAAGLCSLGARELHRLDLLLSLISYELTELGGRAFASAAPPVSTNRDFIPAAAAAMATEWLPKSLTKKGIDSRKWAGKANVT